MFNSSLRTSNIDSNITAPLILKREIMQKHLLRDNIFVYVSHHVRARERSATIRQQNRFCNYMIIVDIDLEPISNQPTVGYV